MTTSGVYTFSVNRDDIIRGALLSIRKLDQLEAPTAEDTSDCSKWLNMMVKQWQGTADFAPGLKTWMRRRGHLFLSTTTGRYTLGPAATGWTESYASTTVTAAAASGQPVVTVASISGISASSKIGVQLASGALFWGVVLTAVGTTVTLTTNLTGSAASGAVVYAYSTAAQQPIVIESAILRDVYDQDYPLEIIQNTQDYDALPSKADATYIGDPSSVYYEFQLGNSYLFTDVGAAQDVTKHLVLTYLEAVQDFVSATDTPEYPQEWYLPLTLGLGKLIAPMYGAKWSVENEANYVVALAIAQRKEPEVVTMFFQSGE